MIEELINYVGSQLEIYNSYLKANTEEQSKIAAEMIPEPTEDETELTPEQKESNAINTEKLFYLLMNENQLRGAIIAAENIKTYVELPKHAETIN